MYYENYGVLEAKLAYSNKQKWILKSDGYFPWGTS